MADELISGPVTTIVGEGDDSKSDLELMDKMDEIVVEKPKTKKDKEIIEELPEIEENEEDVEKEEKENIEEEVPEKDEILANGKTRPSFGKIKKEFPELFKKFPEIQEALGREKAFTEEFETIEDAKEAKEQSADYNFLQEIVAKGTPESTKEFLDVMKENNEDVYKGYVATFLPALLKADQDSYYAITLPLFQNVLRSAYNEGESSGNENLKGAALWLSKFIFNNIEYATGKKSFAGLKIEKKVIDPEVNRFKEEQDKFWQDRLTETAQDVDRSATTKLNSEIIKGFSEKDNDELSEIEKEYIVDKTRIKINEIISADKAHMTKMQTLWNNARKSGFSKQSRDSILSAFLSRAAIAIPEVSKSFIAKAKGKKEPSSETIEERSREVKTRTGAGSGGGNRQPTKVDYSKMSDLDILNRK